MADCAQMEYYILWDSRRGLCADAEAVATVIATVAMSFNAYFADR